MATKKYHRSKPITIPIQKLNIRKRFKSMIVKEYKVRDLRMILKIQPTEFSKFYNFLLEYESVQKIPQIYVCIYQLEI